MANQDLDLAAAVRVAVEEARYRAVVDGVRTDADSLATPQPDPGSARPREEIIASSSSALKTERHAAHVSQRWQVKS